MLDKNSKRILCILNRTNISFPSTQLQDMTNLSTDEINRCLGYLRDNDYLICKFADNTIYYLRLTHKGIHYDEFERAKLKEFLFKSVVTPVIVAAITTLITLLLTQLFEYKNIDNKSSNGTQNNCHYISDGFYI